MSRGTARITKEGEFLVLETPYSEVLVEKIRALPNRRWNPDRKVWLVPFKYLATIEPLAAEYQIPIDLSGRSTGPAPEVMPSPTTLQHWQEELDSSLTKLRQEVALPQIPGLQGELLVWQEDAVRFAIAHKRVLIADDMGVGKTLEALAALALLGSQRPIVICPATAKLTWAREIAKFFPTWGTTIISGTSKQLQQTQSATLDAPIQVSIINYDILSYWLEQLPRADALIFDESHKVKSASAARTKAAKALTTQNEPPVIFLLSGTPIVNYPAELISQLTLLRRIKDLGGDRNFLWHYCAPHTDKFGFHIDGAAHLGELNYKLRSTCMVRRLKSEVMSGREEPQVEMVPTELNRSELAQYKKAEKKFFDKLESEAEEESPTVDWSANVDDILVDAEKDPGALGELSRVRKELGTLKARVIIEWAKEFLEDTDTASMAKLDGTPEPPRKLVIYAEHHDLIDKLTPALGALRITGRETMVGRQRAIDLFQDNPQYRVMIISAAGNENITLTAASDILIAELPWTPKDLTQAIARIDRQGQVRRIAIYEMVTEGTIEGDVLDTLTRKLAVTTHATDGAEAKGNGKSLASELLDKFRKQARQRKGAKRI